MKPKKPLAFVFFCTATIILIADIVPAFFMRSSETPSIVSAIMLISFLLALLLYPVAIILGVIYKTEDAQYKLRNRIGLWGSILIVLAFVALVVVAQYAGGGGVAPMG